jgi:hypothetical protein
VALLDSLIPGEGTGVFVFPLVATDAERSRCGGLIATG